MHTGIRQFSKMAIFFRLVLSLEICLCGTKIDYLKILFEYYYFCLLFVLCINKDIIQ